MMQEAAMAFLKVDPDLCVGCALCVEICPKVFEIRENKAWIIPPKLLPVTVKLAVVKNPSDCESCDCVLVVDSCPTAAVTLEKNS
jgi:ferredoxin